ncbi:integrin alpha-L isoform X1, partial [Silurus meridionalis]
NSTLLVVDQASFIIHVTLQNKGDDSFNTSVVLFYPPGLSLSVFKTIKANRRTLSRCGDRDEGALNKTTCSISLPVYRSNTRAEFEGVFRISRFYKWNESMQMTHTHTHSSDNNGNISTTTVMKTLPVQFSVDVAISPDPERSFSLEDKVPKPLSNVYNVSVQAKLIISPDMMLIIGTSAGGGLLLIIMIPLLWKVRANQSSAAVTAASYSSVRVGAQTRGQPRGQSATGRQIQKCEKDLNFQ